MMAAVWKPQSGRSEIIVVAPAGGAAHAEHLYDPALGECIDAETVRDATGNPVYAVASYATGQQKTFFWVRTINGSWEGWGEINRSCTAVTFDAPPSARAVIAERLLGLGLTRFAAVATAPDNVTRPTLVVTNEPLPGQQSKVKRSLDYVGVHIPPVEQFVPGFLCPGLTIISASPKAGKTTLVHELALAVAGGTNALGVLPCKRSRVLCLFLEDSERRVITRERELLGHGRGCPDIEYSFAGSKWTPGEISRTLDDNPDIRMLIIDTAQRYREANESERSGNVYKDDYKFWGAIQSEAVQRNVAWIMLHHDRKSLGENKDNVVDTVSGTRAVSGSGDHLWKLARKDGEIETKWSVVGRDLDEASISYMRTSARQLRATVPTKTSFVERLDNAQKAREMKAEGMELKEIAKELVVSLSTVKRYIKEGKDQQSSQV